MIRTLRVLAVVFSFCLIAYVVYVMLPQERHVTVTKWVAEQQMQTKQMSVEVDGKTVWIDVSIPSPVLRPAYETAIRLPTWRDKLRFWFFAGIGALLGMYFIGLLVLWARAHWLGKPPPKAIDQQLNTMIAYAVGLFSALLVGAPSDDDNRQQMAPDQQISTPMPVLSPHPVPIEYVVPRFDNDPPVFSRQPLQESP